MQLYGKTSTKSPAGAADPARPATGAPTPREKSYRFYTNRHSAAPRARAKPSAERAP